MRRRLMPVVLTAFLAACGEGGATMTPTTPGGDAEQIEPLAFAAAAATPTTTTTTTTSTTTTTPRVVFTSAIRAVTEAELGVSWAPECPVGVDDLRRLDLTYWNNDGVALEGALVVHADFADDIVHVFGRLFDAGFPVQSMQPITEFGADDNVSMAANNTSAFNCRRIDGRPGVWSQHSFGGAVDINPLVNPWVRGSQVDPPGGAVYVDRTISAPGVIVAGDIVTEAFADIGWHWGGDWATTIDYQHFSHNGK